MTENQNIINQLIIKLNALMQKQALFSDEIAELRSEIVKLKQTEDKRILTEQKQSVYINPDIDDNIEIPTDKPAEIFQKEAFYKKTQTSPKVNRDFEKFIGENLISKIGIIITVIGVAIGAKYSIDHQLISPLARIILGYLMGLGLLGIGFKLKKNYENYSAVLVSGAMAIMYFITFAAYSFYSLMPQTLSFGLMVVFTVFTVAAAINYNKQIIAHIGLVGAYAVPFLLSDGSGRVAVLFTYIAIINVGILVIAFRKYWKSLYYSSFALTWIICLSWLFSDYQFSLHFGLAMIYATVFFLIFYSIFMAYRLIRNEKFQIADVVLLLCNSFIFYGIGYSLMEGELIYKDLLGIFTIGNALVHSIVSFIIYKQKLSDKNIYNLVTGLVLIFITIAIPVQLNGSWVTLLWIGEAALLFGIGRSRKVTFYEILSYPLMVLAFSALVIDWMNNYNTQIDIPNDMLTLININFLTSLLFIASFVFINYLHQYKKYYPALDEKHIISKLVNFFIPAVLLIVIYFSLRLEIAYYFDRLADNTYTDNNVLLNAEANVYYLNDLMKFKAIWLLNYSLFFLTILSFVNILKLKNAQLGLINLGLNVFIVLVFLTDGLYQLSELRVSYLQNIIDSHSGVFNIGIRYICFAFAAALFAAIYKYIHTDFIREKFTIAFDIMLYLTIVWVASSELINWMDIAHSTQSYKLGLSILWGVYALLIIVLGIWKKKKHLRIGAIALFATTLLKLFLYDLSSLDTISKTIVFVSLGILLLIISFLYNKYKNIIANED